MYSKSENSEQIRNLVRQLGQDVSYELIAEQLPKLLVERKIRLDTSGYLPSAPTTEASGIGRYLIYDHPDKSNPFSIWAFAFAFRQKTCIHDHKYKGTVVVLDGPIAEKLYRPTSEDTAGLVGRSDRYKFHFNRDDLTGDFVHQLKRRKDFGPGVSVTLHIYNMEARKLILEKEVDRRNIDQIYSKVKLFDKNNRPAYIQEKNLEWETQHLSF